MKLKEALARIEYLRQKISVVEFLQKDLDDTLPNDAGTRTKERLRASGVSSAHIPDEVVQDVLDVLFELQDSLQIELDQIEQMEFTDVGQGKDKRSAVG